MPMMRPEQRNARTYKNVCESLRKPPLMMPIVSGFVLNWEEDRKMR